MIYDLFIIGGGVNGVAIARDAAGRGISVALAEKGDLASETSSKSTKLFHGGLRYLEYLEIGLVRHALAEREVLLRNMPHIAWPVRFVLPLHPHMRFENKTPVGQILGALMPWLGGRRPDWIIRLGLWLYDHLGGRAILPSTSRLDLMQSYEGTPLQDRFTKAYEYSDVWAQDARLVGLMARDAAERGARIMTRNRVISARRDGDEWAIETEAGGFRAKRLINAAGPWVKHVIGEVAGLATEVGVRLVRGSHIVVPKLYDHDKSYFFQGDDGRIIFVLPYEANFTLIGTTDAAHDAVDMPPECSDKEAEYLCRFASQYFKTPVTMEQIHWRYAGVRPLFDDGATSGTAATRDYVLTVNNDGAPLLNVFGGKITTHRILAEDSLTKLGFDGGWTVEAPLAGGDFNPAERESLIAKFAVDFPVLADNAGRIFSTYGLEAWDIFTKDWGMHFGAGLYAVEVDHLMGHEFAQTAEDILWRRTKIGLIIDETSIKKLSKYMEQCHVKA